MNCANFAPYVNTSLQSGMNTQEQFEQIMAECRELFSKKLHDYGAAWRIMRPSSVTDQIFIKANRIRNLEIKGESWVGEGIRPEFVGIVNYAIVGLIQGIFLGSRGCNPSLLVKEHRLCGRCPYVDAN